MTVAASGLTQTEKRL